MVDIKRLWCIILLLTVLLASCKIHQKVNIDEINIQDILALEEDQSYILFDYYENTLLFLIYDTEKKNPIDGDRDQANSDYLIKFVLVDISSKTIVEEFPMEQFGMCSSAIYAFDGVLFEFITETEPEGFDSSISYINSNGIQKIYNGNFIPFDLGPFLYRNGNAVVFSYTDHKTDTFGVQQINEDLEVKPLLTFDPEQVDFISDEFQVSTHHYAYTVGEDNRVTFYIGSVDKEPIKISLPEGEKIFSFDLTEDYLIVSKTYKASEGYDVYCIETYDYDGNSLETYELREPLYRICANESNQFCGFTAHMDITPVEIYEIKDSIQHISFDSSIIDSTFNFALSNGDGFVVLSSSFMRYSSLWMLSFA